MDTTISGSGAPARIIPLPGLAKLFLIQAYAFLPLLLLLQAVLLFATSEAYRDEEMIELVLWHLAGFGLCVWTLIIIVGMHCRAAWAPENAARYCMGAIILFLALAVRLLTVFGDLRLSVDYGYGGFHEMYIVIMPGMLAVCSLQLWAWARYFRFSPKLRSAFGLETPAVDEWRNNPSRPLGVAILHLFCGSYLVFYLIFFPSVWLASRDMNGGTFGLMLCIGLPQILFPLLLYCLSRRPGKRFLRLHVCFGAWIVFGALWAAVLPAIMYSGLFEAYAGMFYSLHNFVTNCPISVHVLPVLLGALWWRLAASAEDSAWFAGRGGSGWDGPASGRLLLFLSGYAIYYLLSHSGYYLHSLIMSRGAYEIALAILSLALLALAGLAVYWSLKGERRARLAFLALSGGGMLLILGIIALIIRNTYENEHAGFMLGYNLPYLVMEMAILAGGLYFVFRSRPGQTLELSVFKIFCLMVASMYIVPNLVQCVAMLSTGDTGMIGPAALALLGAVAKSPGYYGEYQQLVFSPASLAAFYVLPLLFLAFLRPGRARRVSRPTFLAGLGVWLMLVQLTDLSQTTMLAISRDMNPFMSGFDPKTKIIGMALLLFIFYFCSSGRFARWTEGTEPAGKA